MKSILFCSISLCFFPFTQKVMGQCCPYMNSILVKPASPTVNDQIKIYTQVTTPSLGNKISSFHFVRNDTIFLKSCYYAGLIDMPQVFLDTFTIGTLGAGKYIIHFRANQSYESDTCEFVKFNTKADSMVVNKLNSVINFINNNISIFPNPAKGQQTITIKTSKPEMLNIKLYDISGRLIREFYDGKTWIGEQKIEVDISNTCNGIYFYRITLGGNQIHHKIIKQ